MAPSCARGGGDAKENTTEGRKGAIGRLSKLRVRNEPAGRGEKGRTNIRQAAIAGGRHTAAGITQQNQRRSTANTRRAGAPKVLGLPTRLFGRECFSCFGLVEILFRQQSSDRQFQVVSAGGLLGVTYRMDCE